MTIARRELRAHESAWSGLRLRGPDPGPSRTSSGNRTRRSLL